MIRMNSLFATIVESGSNANGNYIKYSDGTLIQRGTFIYPANTNGYEIYFPTSFKDKLYQITASFYYNNSRAVVNTFSAYETDKISIWCLFFNGQEWNWAQYFAYSQQGEYIAIGKWK